MKETIQNTIDLLRRMTPVVAPDLKRKATRQIEELEELIK